MSGEAPTSARSGLWVWGDRLLDPVLAAVAAGAALGTLLVSDISAIDAELRGPDLLSGAATVTAALALAWRRSRPRAAYVGFVCGCLVVSLSDHYIGLLSMLLPFSLYSLTVHGRRRDAVVALGGTAACSSSLPCWGCRICGPSIC